MVCVTFGLDDWFLKYHDLKKAIHLDQQSLQSLCSKINKLVHKNWFFYDHCLDSLLYMDVDLQPYWTQVKTSTLKALTKRCRQTQRLSLSWCCNSIRDRSSPEVVSDFLSQCGSHLTSLRLANCLVATGDVLKAICQFCTNLLEIDLRSCKHDTLNADTFSSIAQLTKLQRLYLYRTKITDSAITKIIANCKDLRVLNLGSCTNITNYDDIAVKLSANEKLTSIDFWRARTLTSFGIKMLAKGCPNLQELDISWCLEIVSGSDCIIELARNCPHLKKLFMSAIRTISDTDLTAIALNCPDIEQLDILGTRNVTPNACLQLLSACQKLRYLDVSFCTQIDFAAVRQWKNLFPNVDIKKSYQNN